MPSPRSGWPPRCCSAQTLAGCGKSLPSEGRGHGTAVTTVAGTSQLAASGLATKNTTRLGGADPVADAAAVALATYPGLTPATRPQAVVLVDDRDWAAALAASALASSPLRAPILYSEGSTLPALSAQALAALKPTGSTLLSGTPQVIVIGAAAAPTGYRTLALSGEPAALAAQVERLVAVTHGSRPHRVIVVDADGPPALAMPAAGLAAESGAPILPVDAGRHPSRDPQGTGAPASTGHLRDRPSLGGEPRRARSSSTRFGAVRRIYPTPGADGASGPGTSGEDPAGNAIAVARYADGPFGWGVEQPGHGLVFATRLPPA